jgi:hypothetical protein
MGLGADTRVDGADVPSYPTTDVVSPLVILVVFIVIVFLGYPPRFSQGRKRGTRCGVRAIQSRKQLIRCALTIELAHERLMLVCAFHYGASHEWVAAEFILSRRWQNEESAEA